MSQAVLNPRVSAIDDLIMRETGLGPESPMIAAIRRVMQEEIYQSTLDEQDPNLLGSAALQAHRVVIGRQTRPHVVVEVAHSGSLFRQTERRVLCTDGCFKPEGPGVVVARYATQQSALRAGERATNRRSNAAISVIARPYLNAL